MPAKTVSISLPVWVFFDLADNEFPVPSKAAEVLYTGGVVGSIPGLLQINLRVPSNVWPPAKSSRSPGRNNTRLTRRKLFQGRPRDIPEFASLPSREST